MSQNAEQNVRTQSDQITEIVDRVTDLSLVNCYPDFGEVQGWMIEAEARGAAEERAKSAEGQELAIWEYQDSVGQWVRSDRQEHAENWAQILGTNYRSLYIRPANVAALEARAKELEGALKEAASALEQVKDGERGGYNARNGKFVSLQMSDGERADIIHSDVTAECEGALETARAALTREGGV